MELLEGVISIGSPVGDGAEVLIVGVGVGDVIMGTVRAAMLSSGSPPTALRAEPSVEEAISSRARVRARAEKKRTVQELEALARRSNDGKDKKRGVGKKRNEAIKDYMQQEKRPVEKSK